MIPLRKRNTVAEMRGVKDGGKRRKCIKIE